MSNKTKGREVSNNFGATQKYWREKKNLSLQDLYERTGVSNSYISRLERGDRKAPSMPILSNIAQGLGIPVSKLIEVSAPNENTLEDIPLLVELILYNDCKWDTQNILRKEEKESIIQIIEFIFEMSWDEDNKIKQLFDLSELIDDFKEVSK